MSGHPRIQLRSWKRIDKGALVGLAGIAIPWRGAWLAIDDLPVLTTHGKAWATFPGKAVLTREGTVAKIPGTGRVHYVNILRWEDRETASRFSQAIIALVRKRDPGAFEKSGPS